MTNRRRLRRMEDRVPTPSPAHGLPALLAAMTPEDRAAWDAIHERFGDASDDPCFPLTPDDNELMTESLARAAERLGHEPDPVWRGGWPLRYRVDWNNRHDPAKLGRLAGFQIFDDQLSCGVEPQADPDAN